MMETVFLLDMKHFLLTLIVINIVLIILITLFVKIVIIEPNKDSVSYKYWNWTERIVFQIVPGIILLIGIVFFVTQDINALKCKYTWDNGKYQIVEGEITQITIEEFWENGAHEPSYYCSFVVDGVYFPPTNHYTKQEAEKISNAVYVRISYVYDKNTPWPWQIDAITRTQG